MCKPSLPLSVAAGAKETTTGVGFAGYTYMQDITKTKCSSSSIANGTEGRLIDSRDGKVYWVAKLKDGLCWMTQNLDYTGYGTAATSFASGTENTARYYDPGDYVYTLGSGTNSCSSATSTGLSGCTSKGWKLKSAASNANIPELVDVSSWTPTDETYFINASSFIGTDGQSICNKEAGSWLGDENYSQCRIYYSGYAKAYEHYAVGKYYNWMAATNGTAVNSGNVSGSICPTGWSLPISNNTDIGSFGGLLSGLSKGTDITVAPYYYVYGGAVLNSALNSAGSGGRYWSATAVISSAAYSLYFDSSSVSPSDNLTRHNGMSVRCVAR